MTVSRTHNSSMLVETEIAALLQATCAPGSPNRITVSQLRDWAIDYLKEYDYELQRFPDLVGQPHWNLWMDDSRFEDPLFAVLIFRTDDVEFLCGTGNAFEIRTFAESEFPDDPDDILEKMKARFSIPKGSVHLNGNSTKEWLGRGW
jgi:hypothetical protein